MRVAAGVERAVEDGPLVADAVAVGIFEMPDVRDAERDAAALPRVDAHRDVEAVGERRHLLKAAVAVGVFEDFDRVLRRPIGRGGVGIFDRVRQPDAAASRRTPCSAAFGCPAQRRRG